MNIFFSIPVLECTEKDFTFFDQIYQTISQYGQIINYNLPSTSQLANILEDFLNERAERRLESMLQQITICDLFITFATIPSIDTGYEISLANILKKKSYILYDINKKNLLPDRINGYRHNIILYYRDLDTLKNKLKIHLKSAAKSNNY